jgi:hypothetical protein
MPIFTKQLQYNTANPAEAIKEISNHIRFMQEELEYRLMNLDSSNITYINTDETDLGGSAIDGLAEMSETVSGLNSTVSAQGESITALEQTANSLNASVKDLETGEATYLRMDSSGVSVVDGNGSKVTIGKGNLSLTGAIYWDDLGSDAQGQVTTAQNTANGAQSTASGALTTAQQIANGTYSGGTFINGTCIYSPTIYGNTFNVMPRYTSDTSGSFNIYGYYGQSQFQFLSIQYYASTSPYVNFTSPGGAYAQFNFSSCHFYGSVCMPSSYGTSLPSSGSTGQVFFLLE